MKLSEIRQVLESRGWMLTKSLGQNFLHDQNQLRRIVAAGEIGANDNILEIGPGLGPLTSLLLAEAGHVLAIEMDGRMVEFLRERFAEKTTLELLHRDALDFLRRTPRDWREWKLVANLPYSVASPILVELAQMPQRPERMVVTLQREVAQRLMAPADGEHYGLLTLLVQIDYEIQGSFKIPADCFFPVPSVESSCVILRRRRDVLLTEEIRPVFVKIVKRAFSQRRKMMLKLLKQDWPAEQLAAAWAHLQISPQERGEKLSLAQFAQLAKFLHGRGNI